MSWTQPAFLKRDSYLISPEFYKNAASLVKINVSDQFRDRFLSYADQIGCLYWAKIKCWEITLELERRFQTDSVSHLQACTWFITQGSKSDWLTFVSHDIIAVLSILGSSTVLPSNDAKEIYVSFFPLISVEAEGTLAKSENNDRFLFVWCWLRCFRLYKFWCVIFWLSLFCSFFKFRRVFWQHLV